MNQQLNSTVAAVAQMNFTGNVIPQAWFKTITRENGKPNLSAIVILSDIVYWYRPTEQRDEQTGQTVGYAKKFKADMLQRSYAQLAEQFGITKREATAAVTELEKIGVIKRHFRTLEVNGVKTSNVLFIELIPEKLYSVTFPDAENEIAVTLERDTLSRSNVTPPTLKRETNTETTQETTTENKKDIKGSHKSRRKREPRPESLEAVKAYIQEKKYSLNAEKWYYHYVANGWKVGRNPMKDWKASVDYWARNDYTTPNSQQQIVINPETYATVPKGWE